jgi:putative FmdB family regulatory protein
MPYYDYRCDACGTFTELRPMARSAEPCDCPRCGQPSDRAFLTMPFVPGMERSTRLALQTNEKARHEPRLSKNLSHAPGCGCCKDPSKSKLIYRPNGEKTFPSARPWMISH